MTADPRVAPALAWLRDRVPGADDLRCELIAGGRSNLTYRIIGSSGRTWVLRRPPTGVLLPRAHDMRREHRIIAALSARTSVPVPAPVSLCEDETVLGVPFYVMADVPGAVLRHPADVAGLDGAARVAIAEQLVEALVSLHAVDVEAAGLGDLGPREGYVTRQLRRWLAQVDQSGDTEATALFGEQQRALVAAMPVGATAVLVHGDYRLDNLVIDPDSGTVRAILDWEIATLGDPLADLASLLVFWDEPGSERMALNVAGVTSTGGFPTRAEIASRYAATAGIDIGGLDAYVAFAYWKLACVLHGVAHRYRSGGGGGADAPGADMGEHLRWLIGRSRDHLRRHHQHCQKYQQQQRRGPAGTRSD